MAIYFTSDLHFGHANIIHYCARPFNDVAEMDEELVRRWNARVTPNDTIYNLGDVFWNKKNAHFLTGQLNGYKMVVLGNHDPSADFFAKLGWKPLTIKRNHTAYLYHRDYEVIMAHRPRDLPTFTEENYSDNRVILCGHEHTNAPKFILWTRDKSDKARPIMALNMSCEHWGYEPVHIDTVVNTYRVEVLKHIKAK